MGERKDGGGYMDEEVQRQSEWTEAVRNLVEAEAEEVDEDDIEDLERDEEEEEESRDIMVNEDDGEDIEDSGTVPMKIC